jgi:DNA-binding response OmpR family regulator
MAQRILVVDDDVNALRLIAYALHREGFETLTAKSGPEALQILSETPVDLVILDIMMPEMDGYEVCRRIREQPATARLPVIMLTAKSQVEDKVRGFQVGADDYVTKPVLPAELIARVKALLARASYIAQPAATQRGNVITFLGAKGGVGTSTLVVNVGIALAERKKSVILFDANYHTGTIAMQLGLRPGPGLAALFKDAAGIPAKAVTSALVPHATGLRVFPTVPREELVGITIPPARTHQILEELEQQADFVLVDAGACFTPHANVCISRSRRVVVVTESDPLALEAAQQTISALMKMDLHGAMVDVVLVNRTRSATVVSRTEAEQFLGMTLAGYIIPAPEMCFQANRNRIPIMLAQPGNLTVEQIRELADYLARG